MREALVERGRTALGRGDWQGARDAFERALEQQARTPEVLEDLGNACFRLDDAGGVIGAREDAYRLYHEQDNRLGAARVALSLYWDHRAFRGDAAVSNGWLQRAERLLEGFESTQEYAWLRYRQAQAALFGGHDPAGARAHAAACLQISRAHKWPDLEAGALAVVGLAFVTEGDLVAARPRLDEAMTAIISGEVSDLTIIGVASCHVIAACERMQDYERAVQWCEQLKAFAARWHILPLFAVCRTLYAGICMTRGTWGDAEAELTSAAGELAATHRAGVPDALARLGELRRRQGRLDEAATLFAEADQHPLAVLGQAALALDQGRSLAARELVERYLRRVSPSDRTGRVTALCLLARAASALGDPAAAAEAIEELEATAEKLQTQPIRAMARSCRGAAALHARDWTAARTAFEDAVDLFAQAGMPFEAGHARVDLATALASAGRSADAAAGLRQAIRTFQTVGAVRDAELAATFLGALNSPDLTAAADSRADSVFSRLTDRERAVLKLVGEGLSNRQIAASLGVSEHTVHRHVSNILTKLDLPSRAAAATAAARFGAI